MLETGRRNEAKKTPEQPVHRCAIVIGEVVYSVLYVIYVLYMGAKYVFTVVRWWSQLRIFPRTILAALVLLLGSLVTWQVSKSLMELGVF